MLRLCYVMPNGVSVDTNMAASAKDWDETWRADWLDNRVNAHPDVNYFMVTETTDLWGNGLNYKQLLKKYINHVGEHEGVTFLSDYDRSSYPEMPIFTDEEWAELKRLDEEEFTNG